MPPEDQNQQQQQDSAAAAAAAAAASSQKSERPDGLADDYWNGETKTVHFDKLVPALNELRAYKAERDSFEARLPAAADGYEIALPADFKLPDGFEFKVDPDDPMVPVVRQFALDNKLSPDALKQLVAMRASAQMAEDAALGAAAKAEMEKLGSNGPARTQAITTFLQAKLGDDLANALLPGIFTAVQVQAFEKLMELTKGSGAPKFNGLGRDVNAKPEAPDTSNMSAAERTHAVRQYQRDTASAKN